MNALTALLAEAPLPPESLRRLANALAEALAGTHARDEGRGDLFPGDILWDGAGLVTLPDAPHPRTLPEAPEDFTGRAALDAVGYLAPEACRGEPASPRADVFMLGVVLYELATGEHPFADERGDQVVDNILAHHPAPPGGLRGELPLEWDAILSICLHKNPEERYAGALDLATDLARLAGGGTKRRERRRPRWGRIAAFLVILAGLVAGLVAVCTS